jgi:hypothetical protein
VSNQAGTYHASISFDGVVTDRFGECLGYIHFEERKVASPVQEVTKKKVKNKDFYK